MKTIQLKEKTRIVFNKAKALILSRNPELAKINDDFIIKELAEKYLKGDVK